MRDSAWLADSWAVDKFLSQEQDLFLWLPVSLLEIHSRRIELGSAITKLPGSASLQKPVVQASSRKHKLVQRSSSKVPKKQLKLPRK